METESVHIDQEAIGEIDYAVLRCILCRIDTVTLLNKILQVRPIVIEKHLYKLTKSGLLNFISGHFIVTEKGNIELNNFNENVSKKIDEYILSTIERQKKQRIKNYKIIDLILVIIMTIFVILIIYIGKESLL